MPTPTDLLYRAYERRLRRSIDPRLVPRHVGIVLDGHRRYARQFGLSSYTDAYRAGMSRFEEFVSWTTDPEINVITAWVLSTENLTRPASELDPYFDVLVELFHRLPDLCRRDGLSLRFIGSFDRLPERLVTAARRAEEQSGDGHRHLNIAMGYGGRQEIVDAVRDLVQGLADQGVPADQLADHINSDTVEANLYIPELPDPDVLIRTSGESRLSGFLLWQSAYAEFVFVDVFWPAFRRVDFLRAIRDYVRRDRRFGR
ncbi:MAG: di-trans,poly-cis-decaprenylcistransferase [Acidimicrobiia bacterium]|nr:di-trans,poly-cis-decaprenylcistransferase [Acidimicrobiia bacterium]